MAVARVIRPDSCWARNGCSASVSDITLELKLISFSNRLGLGGLEREQKKKKGIRDKNSTVYTFRGKMISKSSLLLLLVLWRK